MSASSREKGPRPRPGAPGNQPFIRRQTMIIALAVLIGYGSTLKSGFMYDDRFFVSENLSVHSLANAPAFFTSPKATTASIPWNNIWRPLRNVSYALDHALWGLKPIGFHLTNLALHLVNCLLMVAIAGRLLPGGPAPLIAGLIFALHPVQVEAVAWISGRDDLLLALFLLSAWLFRMRYLLSGKKAWLAVALACYVLALLSKETATVFPLALPVLDVIFSPDKKHPAGKPRWKEYLIWAAVAGAYFTIRLALLGGLAHRGFWGGSFIANVLTMLWALAQYLRLLVLPLWLRVDYVIPPVVWLGDWRWMAGLAAALTATALAWRYRAARWPLFSWAWFIIFLLPVSNLIPIAAIMAERFLYLPMAGVCLLAGWILAGLSAKPRRILATVLCLAMLGLTLRRGLEWQEPGRFWKTETARSPNSAIAHNNLGQHHYRQGDMGSAEKCFLRALGIHPGLSSARASLGDVYYHTGRYGMAIDQYREYLRLEPQARNRIQAEHRIQRISDRLGQASENR